ncbi:MAG: DNA repair protein RecO [Bacteroidota bacterium]
MLFKTRGIVFKFVKFKETSIIATIFTDKFGLQSYIVNGVRSKRSNNKIALYQPLTLLDMVVYHKENANINRISEIKCAHPFLSIPYEIKKSSIAMFMIEMLNKTVKEKIESEDLFEFLNQSILFLDHLESGYESFHLQFLIKLSKFLGFDAGSSDEILNALYYNPSNESHLEKMEALQQLINHDYSYKLPVDNRLRALLLDDILRFYKLHFDGISDIKSIKVLREVIS